MVSASPPSSVRSGSSTSTWENVDLSPLEMISAQLEQELHELEQQRTSPQPTNKHGVDLDPQSGKARGKLVIRVLKAVGLQKVLDEHPMMSKSSRGEQQAVVAVLVTPPSSCEKNVKRSANTGAGEHIDDKTGSIAWNKDIVVEGIKTKTFNFKILVSCRGGPMGLDVIGEVELRSHELQDQLVHMKTCKLVQPNASLVSLSSLADVVLHLEVAFEYNATARHHEQLEAIQQKKKEHDEYVEQFKQNIPAIQSQIRHPASHGVQTARAALYLPGTRFRQEWHHPGAVSTTPLPDKSRVITPFGRGVVVTFREESRMYVVQLDGAQVAGKSQTLAYLQQHVVKEEPDEPHFRMHMIVSTPYGDGEIEEIRSDGVLEIKSSYGLLYVRKEIASLPKLRMDEMKAKDIIADAIKLTEAGNLQFRNGEWNEATYSYLRALAGLQHVKHDEATHKEKATMLQTMIRCHLNIGSCKLKLNAFEDAEIACSNALGVLTVLGDNRQGNVAKWMSRLGLSDQLVYGEWPAKAHFRRAQAYAKLGKYVQAKQDLLTAVKLNPKDKGCRALLESVSKALAKNKKQEKKTWGGIFEQPSENKSNASVSSAPQPLESAVDEMNVESHGKVESSYRSRSQGSNDSWLMSRAALATASVVTAGVAAFAVLALKRNR